MRLMPARAPAVQQAIGAGDGGIVQVRGADACIGKMRGGVEYGVAAGAGGFEIGAGIEQVCRGPLHRKCRIVTGLVACQSAH